MAFPIDFAWSFYRPGVPVSAPAINMVRDPNDTVVGDFAILRELGRGSSSVVHLAHQLSLGRDVAIKRLLRAWSGDDNAVARFRREAQVIAQLNHDCIVRLYDLVTDGTDIVLVMQYVNGPTLRALCARSAPSPAQALAVTRDVAEALSYAAGQGVVHRDVKPANVFITDTGRCKLGDFGLAKITTDRLMFRSQDRALRGTPMYMSPEQVRCEELTPASDVYALSLTAYELLIGRPLFAEMRGDEILDAHLGGQAASLQVPSPIPRRIGDILRGGLALNPDDRPAALELASNLLAAAPSDWFEVSERDQVPLFAPDERAESIRAVNGTGLWELEATGGWTRRSVATWLDSSDADRDRNDAFAGPAIYQGPVNVSLPSNGSATDVWIKPVEAPLRRARRATFLRHRWPVFLGCFLAGFSLALLFLILDHRL